MTYQQLFYLKFKKGVSTFDLIQQFPKDARRVSEVALLDLPEETLKEIVKEESYFVRLMRLKHRFAQFF